MKEKISENEMIERYEESLDEMYPNEVFGWSASYILKEVDPTQYNCGLSDFEDSLSDEVVIEGGEYDDEESEDSE